MAFYGEIVLYCVEPADHPREMLRSLLRLIRPTNQFIVSRAQADSRREAEREGVFYFPSGVSIERSDGGSEVISYKATADDAIAAYVPGWTLELTDIQSELVNRIRTAMCLAIPEKVRRDFEPTEMALVIGPHEFVECIEHEEPYLLASPAMSVSFGGYGCPNDWAAARAEILAMPELAAVRRLLELCMGELSTCVFWDG